MQRALRQRRESPMSSTSIITPKNSASGTATEISSRRLSECTVRAALRAPGPGNQEARIARQGETVAAPAQRLDGLQAILGVELAPQPPDQHLDHVAVALEVLVVQPLRQLALGDHFSGPQHQMLEDAVFEGGQLDRRTVDSHRLRARIEQRRDRT